LLFQKHYKLIGPESATIGTILRENGYATAWIGKNHNTPSYQMSSAGPFDQWPNGMGFDHFYGFLGGETDQWTPFLFRDQTQVFPWVGRPGYNLTTDMADDAINYMRGLNNAAPDKPFFIYYVPGGSHAPHQPTPEWIKKIATCTCLIRAGKSCARLQRAHRDSGFNEKAFTSCMSAKGYKKINCTRA
jgi:arylsulfatase A-like enzyme